MANLTLKNNTSGGITSITADRFLGAANSLYHQGTLTTLADMNNFLFASELKYSTFGVTETNNIGFDGNDGMLISVPWTTTKYGFQIAFDDSTSANIAVRGKSTNWGSWYKLLHSGNYNSYAPSLTGSGATGTWAINLKANTDNRASNTQPNDYDGIFKITGLKQNGSIGLSSSHGYSGIIGMRPWTDPSGGDSHEFALVGDGTIMHRHGATTAWNGWETLLTSSNYTSYAPSLTGAGAYGNWSINSATSSHVKNIRGIGGSSHAEALRSEFNNYKSSIPRNELATYYSAAYSNGSFYMGYFLSGYDSNPYGGFYVAHYDNPYYVGISSGRYSQYEIQITAGYGSSLPSSFTKPGAVFYKI